MTAITVDDQLCAKYGRESHDRFDAQRERIAVQCDEVIRGRSLKIERVRVSDTAEPYPLQLCEVQVWVCKKGWYGPECDQKCGECRDGRGACDALTGECANDCLSGFYGSGCSELCGKCAGNSPCDVTSGNCTDGCQEGWAPLLCVSELPANSEGGSRGGAVAGTVIGSLFGIVLVVGAVIFIVIYIRRRRGALRTQDNTTPAAVPTTKVYGKPAAAKVDSFGYIDARAATRQLSNASSEKDTYDVINEGTYKTINTYENIKGDHHVYTTPVFNRQESHTSNTSSGYINMGANWKEESSGGKTITPTVESEK